MSPGLRIGFDLDGTLVDCRPRQILALRVALAGRRVDEHAFWAAKRDGLSTRRSLALLHLDETDAARVADHWTTVVEDDRLLVADVPFPTSSSALRHAGAGDVLPVVVTARRRADAVRKQLEGWGLARLVGRTYIVEPAHAAEQKAQVLREAKIDRFVGDTESDAAAAAAAGVPFFGVSNGQRSAAFLMRHDVRSLHDDVVAATVAASRVTG